jgi:DNA-binding MarR family transcriptional regulator
VGARKQAAKAEPEPQRHTGSLIRRAQQRHVALWLGEVSGEITSVQYAVLAVLERRPGVGQIELCEELDLDRSTIADVAKRLERNGLVTRDKHGQDRRRYLLLLTKRGLAELQRLRPRVSAVQRSLVKGLSGAEHAELRRLLKKLLAGPGGQLLP